MSASYKALEDALSIAYEVQNKTRYMIAYKGEKVEPETRKKIDDRISNAEIALRRGLLQLKLPKFTLKSDQIIADELALYTNLYDFCETDKCDINIISKKYAKAKAAVFVTNVVGTGGGYKKSSKSSRKQKRKTRKYTIRGR